MKKYYHLFLCTSMGTLLVLTGCNRDTDETPSSGTTNSYSADVAHNWLALEMDMVRKTSGFSPPVAARTYGYTGIALYEAVRPGMKGFRSITQQLDRPVTLPAPDAKQTYYWPAAANAALAATMRGLFVAANGARLERIDSLEAATQLSFQGQASAEVLERSVAFGKSLGTAVYEWSKTDGGDECYNKNFPATYAVPTGDGMWVPLPGQMAMQPTWGENQPFLRSNVDGSVMPAPLPFSTDPASDFYQQALEVFQVKKNLNSRQMEIARFWSDDPKSATTPAETHTATPSGHSMSIAMQVLQRENASLARAAEVYAKMGIALNDAFICCWKGKYKHNLIRPITYIRNYLPQASSWTPVLNTPPFPEYSSGHSVQSGAASAVLTGLFGTNYSFEDHTHDKRGLAPRQFKSFDAFAQEAAISRLYGGIHFRAAIEEGLKEGQRIGQNVNRLQLK